MSYLLCFSFLHFLDEEVENFDVSSLPEVALRNIEADSFWCMSKLLDGIQVYTCSNVGECSAVCVCRPTEENLPGNKF